MWECFAPAVVLKLKASVDADCAHRFFDSVCSGGLTLLVCALPVLVELLVAVVAHHLEVGRVKAQALHLGRRVGSLQWLQVMHCQMLGHTTAHLALVLRLHLHPLRQSLPSH